MTGRPAKFSAAQIARTMELHTDNHTWFSIERTIGKGIRDAVKHAKEFGMAPYR